ncbi:MAG: LysE family translocator [SAR202 cluster bacterium]|nr:LysE family translocator [SAR202 cluster bacterium]
MDFVLLLQLGGICLLGAVSPGPSLALVTGNTLARGRSYGISTGLGHAVGIGIWALLTVIGVANLALLHTNLSLALQLSGATFLAFVGFRNLRNSLSHFSESTKRPDETFSLAYRGVFEGFAISLFNPKVILFFAAIFSHFTHSDSTWTENAIMAFIAAGVDAAWYTTVAWLVSGAKLTVLTERPWMYLQRTSGALLMAISVYLMLVVVTDILGH